MRIGPASERQRVVPFAQQSPQLPGVLDAARRADRLVAAEHDERREAVLVRPLGVREAVLERVLRRQKRHNPLARHVEAEIGDEMPEVVFFLRADGVVGEEDEGPLAREPADGVIGVDPGVHALARRQLRPRRSELGGEDRGVGSEGGEKVRNRQRSQA